MHLTTDRSTAPAVLFPGVLVGLLALGGCTTTSSQAMLPIEVELVATHPQSLSVQATGTPRRFGFGPPFVPSEVLQETLEEAILQCELFGAIASAAHADYALEVEVTELDKPEAGLDMTTGIKVRWTLTEARTRSTLWIETLTTAFTASTFTTSQLDDRLRASIEGALRENIELGLRKLSEVDLPGSLALE